MKLADQIQPLLHLVFPLQIGQKSAHAWSSLCDEYTTQKVGFLNFHLTMEIWANLTGECDLLIL